MKYICVCMSSSALDTQPQQQQITIIIVITSRHAYAKNNKADIVCDRRLIFAICDVVGVIGVAHIQRGRYSNGRLCTKTCGFVPLMFLAEWRQIRNKEEESKIVKHLISSRSVSTTSTCCPTHTHTSWTIFATSHTLGHPSNSQIDTLNELTVLRVVYQFRAFSSFWDVWFDWFYDLSKSDRCHRRRRRRHWCLCFVAVFFSCLKIHLILVKIKYLTFHFCMKSRRQTDEINAVQCVS